MFKTQKKWAFAFIAILLGVFGLSSFPKKLPPESSPPINTPHTSTHLEKHLYIEGQEMALYAASSNLEISKNASIETLVNPELHWEKETMKLVLTGHQGTVFYQEGDLLVQSPFLNWTIDDQSGTISAQFFSIDEEKMHFSGNVVTQGPFGQAYSDMLEISWPDRSNPHLILSGNVHCVLEEQSELRAHEATLDLKNRSGALFQARGHLVYSQGCDIFEAKKIYFEFDQKRTLTLLSADESIKVDHNGWVVTADHLMYLAPICNLTGLISLNHADLDLSASELRFDVAKNLLHAKELTGKLSIDQDISISSREVDYDLNSNHLVFFGESHVESPLKGSIFSKEYMVVSTRDNELYELSMTGHGEYRMNENSIQAPSRSSFQFLTGMFYADSEETPVVITTPHFQAEALKVSLKFQNNNIHSGFLKQNILVKLPPSYPFDQVQCRQLEFDQKHRKIDLTSNVILSKTGSGETFSTEALSLSLSSTQEIENIDMFGHADILIPNFENSVKR